jgi:hypothetical protein
MLGCWVTELAEVSEASEASGISACKGEDVERSEHRRYSSIVINDKYLLVMRRLFRLLLVGLESLLVLSGVYGADLVGTGSVTDPYKISTVAELDSIRNHLSSEFKLVNDLDMSGVLGEGWLPIGSESLPFTGKLHGGGHVIRGLRVLRVLGIGTSDIGLFGYVVGGLIDSLCLEIGDDGVVGGSNVGGLVGRNDGGTVRASYVRGRVVATGVSGVVGGLVGSHLSGVIESCYADVSVHGVSGRIGGLVGHASGEIVGSYATGYVYGAALSEDDGVGGLVGNASGLILSSYAAVEVCGSGDRVGLFAGSVRAGGDNQGCYYVGDKVGIGSGIVFGVNKTDIGNFFGLGWSSRGGNRSLPYFPYQSAAALIEESVLGRVVINLAYAADISVYRNGKYHSDIRGVLSGSHVLQLDGITNGDTVSIITHEPGRYPSYGVNVILSLFTGAGTSSSPYLIHNAWQLDSVRHHLGSVFRLESDIDLTAYLEGSTSGWLPIGDSESPFTGVFRGNNHVIRGLRIDRPDSTRVGFFGAVRLAVIDSVGIEIAPGKFVRGGNRVGGLAGYNYFSSITACHVLGSVEGEENVGGLVGVNDGATDGSPDGVISDCYTLGEVSGGNTVGGLVGSNWGKITGSYSGSTVRGIATRNFYSRPFDACLVGGLVGYTSVGEIANCYSTGLVSGASEVGGLIGRVQDGTVNRNYTTGEVSATGAQGGFAGSVVVSEGLSSNYYDALLTNSDITSTAASDISSDPFRLYTDFDASVWDIVSNKSYPYLKYQSAPVVIEDTVVGALALSGLSDLDSIFVSGGGISSVIMLSGTERDIFSSDISVDSVVTIVSYDVERRCPSYPVRGVVRPYAYVVGVPMGIRTASQLDAMRLYADSVEAVFELLSDIDMSVYVRSKYGSLGWLPIVGFAGTFHGNNHLLGGIYIHRGDRDSIGFFGSTLSSAVIDSLGIELLPCDSIIGSTHVGGLAGINNASLSSCYVLGSLIGSTSVGGLVGTNRGLIDRSFSGGLVKGSTGVGGLVGSQMQSTISDSYSTSSVTGVDSVGGFAGYNDAVILSSYSAGSVRGSGSLGGFVGKTGDNSAISSSYYDSSCGILDTKAVGLSSTQRYDLGAYSGFSSDKWLIRSGSSYPYLKYQSVPVIISDTVGTKLKINLARAATVTYYKGSALVGEFSYDTGDHHPLSDETDLPPATVLSFITHEDGYAASYPVSATITDLDLFAAAPVLSSQRLVYGSIAGSLSAAASVRGGFVIEYVWYRVSGGDTTLLSGDGSSIDLCDTLSVGEYAYCYEASAGGQRIKSPLSAFISITPATPCVSDLSITGFGPYTYGSVPDIKIESAVKGLGLISSPMYIGKRTGEFTGSTPPPLFADTFAATVSIGKGTNYDASSDLYLGDLIINPAPITSTDLVYELPSAAVYNGTSYAATVEVASEISSPAVITYRYVDYPDSISSVPPVNAGNYSVSVSLSGNSNHLPATFTLGEFEITKASLDGVLFSLAVDTITYGDILSDSLSIAADTTGLSGLIVVTYSAVTGIDATSDVTGGDAPGDVIVPVNAGKYLVYADIPERSNYKGGTALIDTLVITRAYPSLSLLVNGTSLSESKHEPYGLADWRFDAAIRADVFGLVVDTVLYYKDGVSSELGSTGEYDVCVVFADSLNYSGATLSVGHYVIDPRELLSTDFRFTPDSTVYNGEPQGVTVTGAIESLSASYYRDNVEVAPENAGTYEVRIKIENIDGYADTILVLGDLTIAPDTLRKSSLIGYAAPEAVFYDGTEHGIAEFSIPGASSVKVLYNDKEELPVNAGRYGITAELVGDTNHVSATLLLDTLVINKAPLKRELFSLAVDTITYGDILSDSLSIVADTTGLFGAIEVTFRQGDVVRNPVDAGSYLVYASIPASKNFEGGASILIDTLLIRRLSPGIELLANASLFADGEYASVYDPDVCWRFDGSIVDTTDVLFGRGVGEVTVLYDGVEEVPLDAGDYEVSVVFEEGRNYESGVIELGTYHLSKRVPVASDLRIEIDTVPYDGEVHSVELSILSGIGEIDTIYYSVDGSRLSDLPSEVGVYAISVDLSEGTNYSSATDLLLGKYVIDYAPVTSDLLTWDISPVPYDGRGHAVSVSSEADVDLTVYYNGSTTEPVEAGSYVVTVSGAGRNHRSTSAIPLGTLVIEQAEPVDSLFDVSSLSHVYDGVSHAAIIVPAAELGSVTARYYDSTGVEVTDPVAAGEYSIRVSVSGSKNYSQSEIELENVLQISKAVPRSTDFVFNLDTVVLGDNSTSHPLEVGVRDGVIGIGEVLVKYDTSYVAPVYGGSYAVWVHVRDGENYANDSVYLGSYEIRSPLVSLAELRLSGDLLVTYDGESHGVDTLLSVAAGVGAVTLYYNGEAELPVNAGRYGLSVGIADGRLYEGISHLELGDTLEILRADPRVGIFYDGAGGLRFSIEEYKLNAPEYKLYYNGKPDMPYIPGEYIVTIEIGGSHNYVGLSGVEIGRHRIEPPSSAAGYWLALPVELPVGLSIVGYESGEILSVETDYINLTLSVSPEYKGMEPVIRTGRSSDASGGVVITPVGSSAYRVQVLGIHENIVLSVSGVPTGVHEPVLNESDRVWSADGELVMLSEGRNREYGDGIARIYNMSGTLLGSASVSYGETRVRLPRGYYIVVLNGRTYKVRI